MGCTKTLFIIKWFPIILYISIEYLFLKGIKMRNLLLILLFATSLFGQIKATTSDGKYVMLSKNGTWKYVEQKEASLDDMGIWKVSYFVDDFGDPTDSGYITTTELVEGKFSNSATTNSKLYVVFIIKEKTISIKLAEYGSNIVKGSSSYPDDYVIIFKHNGVRAEGNYTATNRSDRLVIDGKKDTQKLLDMLIEGGSFSFVIGEVSEYTSSKYSFKIEADGFSNAYRTLFPSSE